MYMLRPKREGLFGFWPRILGYSSIVKLCTVEPIISELPLEGAVRVRFWFAVGFVVIAVA